MISILDVIPRPWPMITIVDLGAMSVGTLTPEYQRLLEAGACRLIGFEPVADECEKLNRQVHPGRTFLPYAVGDGREHELKICNHPMTSSLYEPNHPLCERFQNLSELMQVVKRVRVSTRRLDDIPEVAGADYIKMDIQGAELDAIRGGEKTVRGTLVVESEVEFVPLYVGQPLFSDVDRQLREMGFLFHRFLRMSGRTFKPLVMNRDPNAITSQILWADAIYVRNLLQLQELEPERLLKLAIILHEVYSSADFCFHVLKQYDEKKGTSLAVSYLNRLSGPAPTA